MNPIIFKIVLVIDILMGSIAQILLKVGMKNNNINMGFGNILQNLVRIYLNKFVIMGSIIYGTSMILWIAVLSKIELSYAYPMVSMNFVIVAILSKILFKEHVSRTRWISIIIIVFGVALLSAS